MVISHRFSYVSQAGSQDFNHGPSGVQGVQVTWRDVVIVKFHPLVIQAGSAPPVLGHCNHIGYIRSILYISILLKYTMKTIYAFINYKYILLCFMSKKHKNWRCLELVSRTPLAASLATTWHCKFVVWKNMLKYGCPRTELRVFNLLRQCCTRELSGVENSSPMGNGLWLCCSTAGQIVKLQHRIVAEICGLSCVSW